MNTLREFGTLRYDTRSREVSVGGVPVHLTRKAAVIMEVLLRDPPGGLARGTGIRAVGRRTAVSDALRSQVHLLRRALADAGFDGIQTMHGTGWRLVLPGEDA